MALLGSRILAFNTFLLDDTYLYTKQSMNERSNETEVGSRRAPNVSLLFYIHLMRAIILENNLIPETNY